jgi:hypothetical protein
MLAGFPQNKLPNHHTVYGKSVYTTCTVEGPRPIIISGIECVMYSVYNTESGQSGKVYYFAESGDYIGVEGHIYVKKKNGGTPRKPNGKR